MIMTNPQNGCQLPGILLDGWIAARKLQIAMERGPLTGRLFVYCVFQRLIYTNHGGQIAEATTCIGWGGLVPHGTRPENFRHRQGSNPVPERCPVMDSGKEVANSDGKEDL